MYQYLKIDGISPGSCTGWGASEELVHRLAPGIADPARLGQRLVQ
jgi:hypothetical protein